jgi:hypothetical protein
MTLPVQDVLVTLVALGCALAALRRVVGAVRESKPGCASCTSCGARPSGSAGPASVRRSA